jgi:flagellin
MRISEAAHNAAYWSIATTMRSDATAITTVQESLGLSMAKLDVAYSAMTGAVGIASEIKARLVAAAGNQSGAAAIQNEIDQLVKQARTIAESASFAGSNWLSTDIEDIQEAEAGLRTVSMVSSYARSVDGRVVLGSIDLDLRSTSLFNVGGGGIFDADPRSPKTIGGIRSVTSDGAFSATNMRAGSRAMKLFTFSGPVDLSGGGTIEFDLTVDADSPHQGLSAPLSPGSKKGPVLIDRAVVEAVLPGSGGLISTYREMASVLSAALSGTGAYASLVADRDGKIIPDRYAIVSSESSGLDGSAVSISNLTVSVGGLHEFGTSYGTRGNSMTLAFAPFKVYEGVEISFQFELNGSVQSHVISRDFVDGVLGNNDGKVDTVSDMHLLLDALIGQPGLVIQETGPNSLTINSDDRLNGTRSRIGFSGISVNIEPLAAFGLEDIDVAANYHLLPAYIVAVEAMLQKATSGAAVLGSVKSRMELQRDFTSSMLDSIDRGISQLVDADMEKESSRLKAMNVQMQLAIQALSIANSAPNSLLQLFAR